jgi:hypothetical protein
MTGKMRLEYTRKKVEKHASNWLMRLLLGWEKYLLWKPVAEDPFFQKSLIRIHVSS